MFSCGRSAVREDGGMGGTLQEAGLNIAFNERKKWCTREPIRLPAMPGRGLERNAQRSPDSALRACGAASRTCVDPNRARPVARRTLAAHILNTQAGRQAGRQVMRDLSRPGRPLERRGRVGPRPSTYRWKSRRTNRAFVTCSRMMHFHWAAVGNGLCTTARRTFEHIEKLSEVGDGGK